MQTLVHTSLHIHAVLNFYNKSWIERDRHNTEDENAKLKQLFRFLSVTKHKETQ